MTNYICRGRRKPLNNGSSLITLEISGLSVFYVSATDTCHDAAYRATEINLAIARKFGAKSVVIGTTPLVRNQMNGVWKTRKRATKAGRAACLRAATGMKVQYV